MANTIWKEVFLIMCSSSRKNARNTERFSLSLRITDDYALQTLCGEQHNIANEEGKLNGLPLNRALRDDDGHMYDIIAGTFLVVGLGEEDFCSLNEQQIKQFSKLYKTPEMFLRANVKILVMPMQWDTIKDDRPSVAEKLKTAPRKDVPKTPPKAKEPER